MVEQFFQNNLTKCLRNLYIDDGIFNYVCIFTPLEIVIRFKNSDKWALHSLSPESLKKIWIFASYNDLIQIFRRQKYLWNCERNSLYYIHVDFKFAWMSTVLHYCDSESLFYVYIYFCCCCYFVLFHFMKLMY